MICPVCKKRWAAPVEYHFAGHKEYEGERKRSFESNEIRCCQESDCLNVVDDHIHHGVGKSYDEMIEETKKELAEGKIK